MTSSFLPFERMEEKVNQAQEESDADYFDKLMRLGEMVMKFGIAGLVAAIGEDPDRHRYRFTHRLVRASGIGEWATVVDEVMAGPASQLFGKARAKCADFFEKYGPGTWQHLAVTEICRACTCLDIEVDPLPHKVQLRKWFSTFAMLRNKTRGHGAKRLEQMSAACEPLRQAIFAIRSNLLLFSIPWAHLYRSLSGRYRVSNFSALRSQEFDKLKSTRDGKLANGVWFDVDGDLRNVDIIRTDAELLDFYCANGGFSEARFELLSYVSGNVIHGESSAFATPITRLPSAQTEGLGVLDSQGATFGNLPNRPTAYVPRRALEQELFDLLSNDRHPIITLHGLGGIGKTSLALSVLRRLADCTRYSVIVWFSARDIELLPEGPKPVRPKILDRAGASREYSELFDRKEKDYEAFFARELQKAEYGPTLFVFDNFETVVSPEEQFRWLDTYIRLPNKILITTRLRAFKGDYPVEVRGMEEAESRVLIDQTAGPLGILDLLTDPYRSELHVESEGHPYVMKILLGEVANRRQLVNPERIIADKERMLDALFERSYASLSPAAKRVFLTLSGWRSMVPLLALKAVLLRPQNERMDIDKAILELTQSAMVEEISHSEGEDEHIFLHVPLAASLFGNRKRAVDASENAVQADLELLHSFGPARVQDVRNGLRSPVEKLFRSVSARVARVPSDLEKYAPVLEFLAKAYSPACLLLADLYEEHGHMDLVLPTLQRYLERNPPDAQNIWERIAHLCEGAGNVRDELHAWSKVAELGSLWSTSAAANRLTAILRGRGSELTDEDRRAIVSRAITAFHLKLDEADGTDLSRLAWLHLNIQEDADAKAIASLGLQRDPTNTHLLKLADRLGLPL